MRRATAVLLVALALCGVAYGWPANGSGDAATGAKTLPVGNVPAGSVGGPDVTLTWTASTFPGGGAVPGYVVRRYESGTLVEAAVGAACSGIVSATTCIEQAVTSGSWVYTITPAAGAWRGTESGQSAPVVVP